MLHRCLLVRLICVAATVTAACNEAQVSGSGGKPGASSPGATGGGPSPGSGGGAATGGTGTGVTLPDAFPDAGDAGCRPRPVRRRDPQGGDRPPRPHAAARQLRIDGRGGRHALEVADGAAGAGELRLGSQVRRAERRAAVLSPVHDLHDRRRLPAQRVRPGPAVQPPSGLRGRRRAVADSPALWAADDPDDRRALPALSRRHHLPAARRLHGQWPALHQRRSALSHGWRHVRGAAQVLRGRGRRPRLRGCPLRDAGGDHPGAADGPGGVDPHARAEAADRWHAPRPGGAGRARVTCGRA